MPRPCHCQWLLQFMMEVGTLRRPRHRRGRQQQQHRRRPRDRHSRALCCLLIVDRDRPRPRPRKREMSSVLYSVLFVTEKFFLCFFPLSKLELALRLRPRPSLGSKSFDFLRVRDRGICGRKLSPSLIASFQSTFHPASLFSSWHRVTPITEPFEHHSITSSAALRSSDFRFLFPFPFPLVYLELLLSRVQAQARRRGLLPVSKSNSIDRLQSAEAADPVWKRFEFDSIERLK